MKYNAITDTQEELLIKLSELIIYTLNEQGIIQPSTQTERQDVIWFNVQELCAYLPEHPCRNTIYKWKRKGIIPFHKRSKHLYFLRSEIDAWLKSKRGLTKDEMKSIVNADIRKGGVR